MKNKVIELLKSIFYLSHYASLLSKANFKVYRTDCSKLCLLKCNILLEKQRFRLFQHSGIRNETRGVNKNHFQSSTLRISVKVRKFQNIPRPCSNLCQLKCIIFLENQHFPIFQPQIFAVKVDKSINTIFYLTHYPSLLK